jgi:hypothetical protein
MIANARLREASLTNLRGHRNHTAYELHLNGQAVSIVWIIRVRVIQSASDSRTKLLLFYVQSFSVLPERLHQLAWV